MSTLRCAVRPGDEAAQRWMNYMAAEGQSSQLSGQLYAANGPYPTEEKGCARTPLRR